MIKFRRSLDPGELLNYRPSLNRYLEFYLGNQLDKPQLSQVITRLNAPLEELYRQSRHFPGASDGTVPPGFPWITPVLGSGTVDHGLIENGAPLRKRLDQITEVFGSDRLPDGLLKAELARQFGNAMIRERVGDAWEPRSPVMDKPTTDTLEQPAARVTDPLEEPTAMLLLAVALLTRLRYEVMAAAVVPVPRWEDDGPWTIDDSGLEWPEINVALVGPARDVLQSLHDGHDRAGEHECAKFDDGVAPLISERLEEIQGHKVASLGSLRLLTECAWFYLVRDCLTYPGWSDLMLELTIKHTPIPHQEGRARPLYDRISRSADQIREQYRAVAEKSWETRTCPGTKLPANLHDDVASLLKHQAALQASSGGPTTVPLASAFVTGFDLELELALLAAGQPFVLAVPVLAVTEPDAREVSMLWIGHVVDQSQDTTAQGLKALDGAQCIVLSGNDQFGRTEENHRGFPIVVRLSGCPAIEPPDLSINKDLCEQVCAVLGWVVEGTDKGSIPAPKPELKPIFVLDEYVSGALGAIESFLDHLDDARLGLPRWIAGTPGGVNARFARFWLVMGAQLGDSSIRQRIVAQLAATAVSSPQSPAIPGRSGLVVNKRIGPLDGRLMQWQGFDIVQDRCEQLRTHLDHYIRHLEEPAVRCDPADDCTL